MLVLRNPPSGYKCPRCNGIQVRRDHRAGVLERIISLINIYPYHCLQCPVDVRFFRFRKKSLAPTSLMRRSHF